MKCMIAMGLLSAVSLVSVDVIGAQMLWGRCEYEALTNLKIDQVVVSSWLPRDKSQQLYDRAIKHLAEAGIHPKRRTPVALGYPSLTVTFDALDLSKTGPNALSGNTLPGKWLYRQKLEVWEYVYTKRYPNKPIEAVVCSITGGFPKIVGDVPFEELQTDLEWLLDQFILVYKGEPDGKGAP